LYQGENDVVQKFVLEDFSTEWIDIKKLVWWFCCSLFAEFRGIKGEESHLLFFISLKKFQKMLKIFKFKERKRAK